MNKVIIVFIVAYAMLAGAVTSSFAIDCTEQVSVLDGRRMEYCYDDIGNLVRKRVILPSFTLTVNRTFQSNVYGTAGGTVSTGDLGLDFTGICCGYDAGCGDCTEEYYFGTIVGLTATPDQCSIFDGWTGGGCSGNGNCTVNLMADTEVTANFNCKPPVADYSFSYRTQLEPAFVDFTDISEGCPSVWLWDFGDGTARPERTEQNPMHTYENEGTYTPSLDITSCGGSSSKVSAVNVIVGHCYNDRTIIPGKAGYSTPFEAYAAAAAGDTIKSHARTFTGSMSIDKDLFLDGGYGCEYSINPGKTIIVGDMTIESGSFTVTISNYSIE